MAVGSAAPQTVDTQREPTVDGAEHSLLGMLDGDKIGQGSPSKS